MVQVFTSSYTGLYYGKESLTTGIGRLANINSRYFLKARALKIDVDTALDRCLPRSVTVLTSTVFFGHDTCGSFRL